jgi:MoaA/NifB/PqqE/SkfB family radical SAM enzyme
MNGRGERGPRLADGARLWPAVVRSRWLGALPYKVLLSLTDGCNHRCRHCAIWQRRPGDELRPAEVARLLASLPTLRWLDLTGGEIVTRPDHLELAAAVRQVARRLVFLHFATNGLRTRPVVDFARALRVPGGPSLVVTVSVDGPEAVHDALRGRRGAFRKALETARALDALPDVAVYLGTTLTPDTGPHLAALQAALRDALPHLAGERWHVNPMQRSPHFFGNADQAVPGRDQALAWLTEVERLRGPVRDPFALVERLYLRTLRWSLRRGGRAPVPCQALRASVFVGPTGTVHPCHIRPAGAGAGAAAAAAGLGNVRDHGGDLAALLRAPAARAERARLARHGCDGCWTPCEAYHAIVAAPLATALRALEWDARRE